MVHNQQKSRGNLPIVRLKASQSIPSIDPSLVPRRFQIPGVPIDGFKSRGFNILGCKRYFPSEPLGLWTQKPSFLDFSQFFATSDSGVASSMDHTIWDFSLFRLLAAATLVTSYPSSTTGSLGHGGWAMGYAQV